MTEPTRKTRKVNAHTRRPGGPWDTAKTQRRADALTRQAAFDLLPDAVKRSRRKPVTA